jgi:colanic acid/amylovoran biosynthesis glycosyltransferase
MTRAMADAAPQQPTVAHFRRVWFQPTETFLHGLVSHCTRTRPLLIGLEQRELEGLPFEGSRVALAPRGSWPQRWHALRSRLAGPALPMPLASRRARRELSRHRARLLHAHFGFTGYEVLGLRRRCRLPLVTSFYGFDVAAPARQPLWAARYRELFAEGELFLAEGPALRHRLTLLGCPPEKTALHPIAIDPRRYPFRERAPRRRGEPTRLLFCGRLCEKKGVLDAVEAVALARTRHPQLVLRLAGDGPLRPQLEASLERLGLADAAQVLGFVSHARMLEEMDAADLFLQPSVTGSDGDTEGGAPTTLLEAQACGLPVLATGHADIPHVVVEGESALLCAEGDVPGLAENLLALLEDPGRWAKMGRRGREKVEADHDLRVAIPRLEQRYLELIGG